MLPTAADWRKEKRQAWIWSAALCLPGLALVWWAGGSHRWWLMPVAAAVLILIYRRLTAKTRRRMQVLAMPFPPEWDVLLDEHVSIYRRLDEPSRERFRRLVQVFLDEVPVTGAGVDITDLHRVLVAASAVIPILGLPNWEYRYLSEVVLYSGQFNRDFQTEAGDDRHILGMVHGALNNGVVLLSAPALVHGFANDRDKRNVGIHEFAHMIDKADGTIDGLPQASPDHAPGTWLQVMDHHMDRDARDIDNYGRTNRQEFLAVLTEYFFENPKVLAAKHPDLYQHLATMYQQDPALNWRKILPKRKDTGRNDPCPCGSGRKFKRCCLRKLKGKRRSA